MTELLHEKSELSGRIEEDQDEIEDMMSKQRTQLHQVKNHWDYMSSMIIKKCFIFSSSVYVYILIMHKIRFSNLLILS